MTDTQIQLLGTAVSMATASRVAHSKMAEEGKNTAVSTTLKLAMAFERYIRVPRIKTQYVVLHTSTPHFEDTIVI